MQPESGCPQGLIASALTRASRCDTDRVPRFLTLADVADVLNVSAAQAYALVRSGDIRAIKVGGRGQWRIEESELEDYIARMYAETAAFVHDLESGPLVAARVSDDSVR